MLRVNKGAPEQTYMHIPCSGGGEGWGGEGGEGGGGGVCFVAAFPRPPAL